MSTKYIKEYYSGNNNEWQVMKGDILNDIFVNNLGKYDVVYSWGVLHHTGNMYKALENASNCVNESGYLIIAIYNTQFSTPVWKKIKRLYSTSPLVIKYIFRFIFMIYFTAGLFVADVFRIKNPLSRYKKSIRGMAIYTDVIDWIGGYPFETAKPEEIFDFYKKKGFELEKLITVGGKMGCNEFVFKKIK